MSSLRSHGLHPIATKLELVEVLTNGGTGEARVCFKLPVRDLYIVVKFFDSVQREKATFKVFRGSYQAVASHWRTKAAVLTSEKRLAYAYEAIDVISDLLGAIDSLSKEAF